MTGIQAPNPFEPPRAAVQDAGEEVLVLAHRSQRLAAFVLDVLPFAFCLFGGAAAVVMTFVMEIFAGANVASWSGIPIAAALFVAGIGWIVYNFVLIHRHDQTWGKRIMRVRVARTDGSRPGFARYLFLRCAPMWVTFLLPGLNLVALLVDPLLIFRGSYQCLHDTLADTIVVKV